MGQISFRRNLVVLLNLVILMCTIVSGIPLNWCDDVFKAISSEDTVEIKTPSPQKINFCTGINNNRESKCSFNTAKCTDDCGPLGHQTDEWDCPISCECKSSGFIEGDIKFDEQNIQMIRKTYGKDKDSNARGASIGLDLWTNRINGRVKIPFVMRNDTSNASEIAIYEAVAAISGSTCIDFINRTTEVDFIEIIPDVGCWSYVGRRGGKQELSIGPGCEISWVVQHEFLHALGFWHEQSRPDRDDYVIIQYDNIIEDKIHAFELRAINSLGSPYDLQSIMHYHAYAFTKNGDATILDKATNEPIIGPDPRVLTQEDINQLTTLYCNPVVTQSTTTLAVTKTTTAGGAATGLTPNVYFTVACTLVLILGTYFTRLL
uniref:Metalloendopeptidase n=1 Tax=Ciona intestinalis TaxID=7719 RepID=H2XN17_CIOIN